MLASFKEQIKWANGLIACNAAITVGAWWNRILPAFFRLGLKKYTRRREWNWNGCFWWHWGAATLWSLLRAGSSCRAWRVRLLISPPDPIPPHWGKAGGREAWNWGRVLFGFMSIPFLPFPPANLPLHPSAVCGNVSIRMPVLSPSTAMYRKRQSIYLRVSEPAGKFSLVVAIKPGVGRQDTV